MPAYAEETNFFYVDLQSDDPEDNSIAYEDFISNLESMLPDSFSKVDKWYEYGGHNQAEHIRFENDYMTVAIADNEWSIVVIFRYKHRTRDGEELDALDKRGVRIARSVVRRLLKSGYELRVRNGPWMSSKVEKVFQVFI